jgi:hypothetical protein
MMKKIIQTDNVLLRAWGNLAGYIGGWFLVVAEKYGDVYDFSDLLSEIEEIDDTGVWKGDF